MTILLLKNQHQHTKFLQLKDDSPVHEDEDGKDHHVLDKQVESVADPTSLKAPIVSKNRSMPEKSFDLIRHLLPIETLMA